MIKMNNDECKMLGEVLACGRPWVNGFCCCLETSVLRQRVFLGFQKAWASPGLRSYRPGQPSLRTLSQRQKSKTEVDWSRLWWLWACLARVPVVRAISCAVIWFVRKLEAKSPDIIQAKVKSEVDTEEGLQTLVHMSFVVTDGFASALTLSAREMEAGWLGQGPSEVVLEG